MKTSSDTASNAGILPLMQKGGAKEKQEAPALPTLPGDEIRQVMWRFADRFDIQMMVQATRSVARGAVARLVAQGERNTHEWTEAKNQLLRSFDESGITAVFMDPDKGGLVEGPKNLVMALVAFELAWVDAGAATCSLATNLALSPIFECGTKEQRNHYMEIAAPKAPGDDRIQWRGAFALTEPLPYVGVDTGILSGKVRIVEWKEGQEPILQVEKRGRFITNMDFAQFVTAAVDSDDPRIKGSCMVILEEGDPGTFDRGAVTKKLVHQLSSTRDPIFNKKVPASRIVGGYQIKDGIIVPNHSHNEILENVFRRTRVPVGLMTSAKLLSAVEPIIRYQRSRFRGGESGAPGTPRYELGLQQKEDALHRLIDVWSSGEAGASLGFMTERTLDEFEPLEKAKNTHFAEQGNGSARSQLRFFQGLEKDAIELIRLRALAPEERDEKRHAELSENTLVRFAIYDALLNVLCPAVKLWNTSTGATMMREAVSLMGGYGITEDCPGFLGQKWMDAQLEATYEGPESVQRRHLAATMTNEIFLAQIRAWIKEMREIASTHPGTGACTVATAMEIWSWTINYLKTAKDADGLKMYNATRQGVSFPIADSLCWILSARALILDVLELEAKGPQNPNIAGALDGYLSFYFNLAHIHSAKAASISSGLCAEVLYGYRRHPSWDNASTACCFDCGEPQALETYMAGFSSAVNDSLEVRSTKGEHPVKAGPCATSAGLEKFAALRSKLDRCLTGARLAKDIAADALTKCMIPESLDYPG